MFDYFGISFVLFGSFIKAEAAPYTITDALSTSWDFNGGLVTITNTTKNQSIQTFCIELDEYTQNPSRVYDVSDDKAVWGGRNVPPDLGPDQLRWINKVLKVVCAIQSRQCRVPSIPGVTYAIWYLEDEYWDIRSGHRSPDEFKTWLDSKVMDRMIGMLENKGKLRVTSCGLRVNQYSKLPAFHYSWYFCRKTLQPVKSCERSFNILF